MALLRWSVCPTCPIRRGRRDNGSELFDEASRHLFGVEAIDAALRLCGVQKGLFGINVLPRRLLLPRSRLQSFADVFLSDQRQMLCAELRRSQ